jgi:tRNA dimethylallyltransferase
MNLRQSNKKLKLIVICGPTATGKSAFGVRLAKKVGGEIISADSRQVYRGLNIGSGKIKKYETYGVKHWMLDIANPKKQFSVAQFQKHGQEAITDILKRGKVPILVGGTGLYIDALVYETQFPQVPPNKKLRSQLEKMSADKLFKMLMKLDSGRAKTIDRYNPVRLIRAIEIAKALGRVPKLKKKSLYDVIWIGLTLPEAKLKLNIKKRLASRMKEGMVSEVKKLHENGLSWKRLYEFGLEYRFVSLYLKKELTKTEMLAQLETAIYQYSRRQMTWFKANKNIHWIDASNKNQLESIFK